MTIKERYQQASSENNIKEMVTIARMVMLSGRSVDDLHALREGDAGNLDDKLISFTDEEWTAWVKFTEDAEPGIASGVLDKIRAGQGAILDLIEEGNRLKQTV